MNLIHPVIFFCIDSYPLISLSNYFDRFKLSKYRMLEVIILLKYFGFVGIKQILCCKFALSNFYFHIFILEQGTNKKTAFMYTFYLCC